MPGAIHHWLCSTAFTGGWISSLLWKVPCCAQRTSSEHPPTGHERVWPIAAGRCWYFHPFPCKERCAADSVRIFIIPLCTCQRKQQSSKPHAKFGRRGVEGVLCQTLYLQEPSPQPRYCAKGTEIMLTTTFPQHFSIKVQYLPFSSACSRYWITS